MQQVILARIDADVERGLVDVIMGGPEATAQHLPVILLWLATKSSKKAILYDGPHERHAIVEFVQKQMRPSVTKLGSIEDVNNFVANPRHQAIGMPPSEAVTVSFLFAAPYGCLKTIQLSGSQLSTKRVPAMTVTPNGVGSTSTAWPRGSFITRRFVLVE